MTFDIAQAAAVSKDVAQDYETLRTAAHGDGLAFEARNGLALFLRRGMWGWARAISDSSDGMQPTQRACAGTVVDDNDKTVVQLLDLPPFRWTGFLCHSSTVACQSFSLEWC
jgi:hypothetical protein